MRVRDLAGVVGLVRFEDGRGFIYRSPGCLGAIASVPRVLKGDESVWSEILQWGCVGYCFGY